MIPRSLICIPTYNNAESIINVIKETLEECPLPVLIIDDGSDIPVLELIQREATLKQYLDVRLNIYRFEKNKGKGAAIQKAFEMALLKNFTHLITIDGDGQHRPTDLNLILNESINFPWALIIGKRKFTSENIPKSSKFGRTFSNFWVKYQTDKLIEDSQSGFRSYPLFYVQNYNFFTKKYDFEIEVLIRLIWKKVEVKEIEIDVYYPPPEERVSHFDKFWDNVKISILNTVLVIFSLLRINISRSKIIASVSLGVFIGVIPIYGFQIYLAALLAFLFRLNFPLMFVAGQISLPPLIPIWTFASLQIGSKLSNTTLSISFDNVMLSAQKLIPIWILGSVILGLTLAVIAAIMTFFLAKNSGKKVQWTGKNRGGRFGNWFMFKITEQFGPNLSYFILLFICPYFYFFSPKAVYSHNQYFKIAMPELGFFKRQIKIIQTFYKLGQILIDNYYTNCKGPEYFNIIKDGQENIDKALEQNKGLILVGAHVGAWMFSSKIFAIENSPKINIVEFHAEQSHSASDKIKDQKINYINNKEEAPIFKINQALTQNEIVILMADRPLNLNIELVTFFGKLVPIDLAAFKIAITKKSPISFSFGFKGRALDYNLSITSPLSPQKFLEKGKQEAIIALILNYTKSLEQHLKTYPTQWFNFYPFWSILPEQKSSENSKGSK